MTTAASQERRYAGSDWARQLELSYVLVADADVARAAATLKAIKPFKLAVLVARDARDAIETVRRFGAPILLVVDLALPRPDGLAVIDATRAERSRSTEVVAWAANRELSQFASERLARMKVRTLDPTATDSTLRAAIEAALQLVVPDKIAVPTSDSAASAHLDHVMRGLAESARRICGTAGAAVYVKALGETQFRAFVTWACDTAVPQSPYYTPRIFDWVLETGEALVYPALDAEQLPLVASTARDPVRGLVAVPIVSRLDAQSPEQIVGTICVFDVHPLTVDSATVETLKALGRNISLRPVETGPREERTAAGIAATPAQASTDSNVDPLVLVLDRRDGDLAIARELARARREQKRVSMVLFGIDPVGQQDEFTARAPLTQLAKVLIRAVRESDLVIDWGQHELVIVLPGLGMNEARQVAERVRAAMQVGGRSQAAVSAGVEELQGLEAFGVVVDRAREKVRTARERGHNRVA